jgi:hypothetical protein
MQRGRLIADGTAREVIKDYERLAGHISLSSAPSPPQSGEAGRAAEITSIVLTGPRAERSTTFHTGEALIVRIEISVKDYIADAVMEVFFFTPEGVLTCEFTTEFGEENLALSPGRATVEFLCRELQLQPGLYSVDISIKQRDAAFGDDIDVRARCASLRVDPGRLVRGEFYAQHEWRVVEENTIEASPAKEAGEIPV